MRIGANAAGVWPHLIGLSGHLDKLIGPEVKPECQQEFVNLPPFHPVTLKKQQTLKMKSELLPLRETFKVNVTSVVIRILGSQAQGLAHK